MFQVDDRNQFLAKVREFLQRPRVRRWVRLPEVAKRLNIGTRKLRQLSEAGGFPPIITKGRVAWVDEQQVLEWQRSEMRKAEEAPLKKAMRADFVRAGVQRNELPDFLLK